MNIKEKLDLWVKITKVNPEENRTSWTINLDGRLSDYDIRKMDEYIGAVAKYDIDGIYTNVYLRKYFNTFIKDRKISVEEFMNNAEDYISFVNDCKILNETLDDNKEIEEQIVFDTRKVIQFYGIKDYDLDIEEIIDLRISAHINIDNLKISQFKRGVRDKSEPKFMREVYMVDNVDKLIKTINEGNFNCISLNYVYDREEPSSSYFAFIVKNGENIFILADKPEYGHPNQKYMKRTPGRNMYERMEQTHFPYSLTDLQLSKYSAVDKNSEKLEKDEYIKLGTMGDMQIYEALWVTNMFSLINKKFFKEEYECKELSYVGGMIQHPLLNTGKNELVIYDGYEKLNLEVIENPAELEIKYERESLGLFKKEIEKFKDKVDMDLINSVGKEDKKLIGYEGWNEITRLSLNVNEYGTKEEIINNQKWITRYNFAKEINKLAEEDYNNNKSKVLSWYKDRVTKNISKIMDYIVYDELKGNRRRVTHTGYGYSTGEYDSMVEESEYSEYVHDGCMPGIEIGRRGKYYIENCIFSGMKAGVVISLFPSNTEDIMKLTGCTLEELPEQLRDWSSEKRDTPFGYNPILSNLDPCDWVIHDYWAQLNLRTSILLAKSEYNRQYVIRGFEPKKFWLNKKKDM